MRSTSTSTAEGPVFCHTGQEQLVRGSKNFQSQFVSWIHWTTDSLSPQNDTNIQIKQNSTGIRGSQQFWQVGVWKPQWMYVEHKQILIFMPTHKEKAKDWNKEITGYIQMDKYLVKWITRQGKSLTIEPSAVFHKNYSSKILKMVKCFTSWISHYWYKKWS